VSGVFDALSFWWLWMKKEKNIFNVLILEDDDLLRECLLDAFRDKGFSCLGAECASKAFSHLNSQPWDAGVIDLSLPDMRGEEFIVMASKIQPGMKFIIYTGEKSYTLPSRLINLGMTSEEVFIKPTAEEILINAVRGVCEV
jgi:DNA-binding NtrC family response regulator